MNYQTVIDFWFKELTPKQWFAKDEQLDQIIKERFQAALDAAAKGECFHWRSDAKGRLAEIIVLDQFSRNIYRDDAKSFTQDAMALVLAQEAVALKVDQSLTTQERAFLYMPYMHSESLLIHEEALRLYSIPGLEYNLDFEKKHKAILERFHRYPHRNKVLGRQSTAEEIQFLKGPGSSF